ncbi:ABC-type transport auxiliary lipoprotein family protein [Shimwellia blattae]|uniref:Putative lipoprotein n=1 Tax=Shimwellia blattae (strain ATCC 29907 / DSM 4481 / JCM 1650 / NBRC 105725 / CDC 9005-74) TaxID=630626 RepID=I2B9J7_SHIBC|nr:ABC-type transport auxiliary lipoprotein family protein [Shimwellia blattae]AFJ47201.1 putative lipoprotein [Shimwellia blattae DSM 4481 = NBRC 105725]GAB82270.1 hypothetical protein EB105725_21_00680 [Shimwellia blattae DSM 4481 = NBRC 105725]VDY64689.1 ABC-type uncharacterized transport system, auxiliary component [Shimwellia blattae]VEC22793.1 ABC-type uncharacterized transport system, auxiliary component [Shimwellia blattae]
MKGPLYRSLTALSMLALAGCTLVKQPPPVQRYGLAVSDTQALCLQPQPGTTLKVTAPRTSHFLDSDRIAVRNEQHELMVYQGARWQDRAPLLLRDALAQALQSQHCSGTVITDEQRLPAQFRLSGQLAVFEGDYSQTPGRVKIDIWLYLSEAKSGSLLASRRFIITRPIAAGSGTAGAVRAFAEASGQLAAETGRWLQPQLSGQ